MFSFLSIRDYHTKLLNGQTTCVEAVSFYLKQIQDNKSLNAFLEVYPEEAMLQARRLDQQRAGNSIQGKLHGVVLGLKDVIAFKGHHLSASSKILGDFTSLYHATAVEKLLSEGAIIIGRQNCDEFAMGSSNENSAFGYVRNARDTSRVPGGSSGGSAVAVQAGLCMLSLGSDTGGSVRQPADFCGIIGLKPSYGRISRYGLIAYASSFDQIGILGNTVDDIALVLEVIAGPDDYDSTVLTDAVPAFSKLLDLPQKPPKMAYFREAINHPGLDPQIKEQFEAFLKRLKNEGYIIEAIDFDLFEYVVPAYYILTTAEASSNLSRYDGVKYGIRVNTAGDDLTEMYQKTRSAGFGNEVKRRIMLGTFVLSAGYFEAYFAKAQKVRRLLVEKTNTIFSEYGAILSPTVPTTAFPIGEKNDDPVEMFLADIYTVFANLVGIPAISLPLFEHKNGMPFGMQVMVSRKNESSLLGISKNLMELAGKA